MNSSKALRTIRPWLNLSNQWLESWIGRLYLMSAVAIVYVQAYQKHGARPGASPIYPQGWWGWFDQGQYLKSAAGLARITLGPDTYWYPLGYPLLGAPFLTFLPDHAFFVPNLILAVGIAGLFFEISRRLITPVETVLLMAVFILCYRGLLSDTLVVPWNTIPTHFFTYAVILLVFMGPPTRKLFLLAALCVGLTYLCRTADALCAALLVGVALLRLPSWSERIRVGVYCSAIVLLFCGSVLLINHTVFGSWLTPYDKAVAHIGFGSYPFLPKLFWLIVDARPVFNEPEVTLSSHFPWLLLVIPGSVYFLRAYTISAVGILLSISVTYFLYFHFNDFWPGNMFKYHVVHYLVWTFPILALLSYLGIREAWKYSLGRWSYCLMFFLGVTLWLLTLRQEVAGKLSSQAPVAGELPASPAQPVDWIFFHGLESPPTLSNGWRTLEPMVDFVLPGQTNGMLVLLSKKARTDSLRFATSGSKGFREVEFGRFAWHFRSPASAFRSIIEKHWRKPRIISVTKIAQIDVAGPAGGPDGHPDEVIEVELATSTLRKISVWDLETTNHSGHWTSTPGKGWWLIKVLPSSRVLPKGRSAIRLCVPNLGQLETAPSATLRGLDDFGQIHLQVTVHANRPAP